MDKRLDRAFERLKAWPTAVSVANTDKEDCPLIYVNDAFTALSGYGSDECIGRNCRFLQGDQTDPVAVEKLRKSVIDKSQISVCLLNYRRDGTPFHNLLVMAPIDFTDHRHLIMGCQYEIQRAISDSQIQAQLANVHGAFRQIERPHDPNWRLFSDSVETRTVATRMLVDSYMFRAPSIAR
ncbi:MAG: PAS domain-containing protein [Pseudomonadota bacterium]